MYEIRERGHFGGGAPVPKGDCKRKTADARPEEQCCCKHLLADEPDFKAQPMWTTTTVTTTVTFHADPHCCCYYCYTNYC